MLTISDFQKKYPASDNAVLSIPQFHIDKGIYWIKGENGSGKTSLIKSIAGLIPFNGTITVNGCNIANNRMAYTKMVNYAEAEPQYPGFLTGKELLHFYKSTNGGDIPAALMNQLGMEKFLHQKTAVYSSGMMKKLSLVLAFTGNPQLILLDEPLIALDVEAVEALQNTIATYCNNGVSFIITSHQPLSSTVINYNGIFGIKNQTLVPQ
jgi:ABC-2 type transport system ATP-binding protein